jgi:hypothetical protein
MNKQEFKQLIREEIRKVLKESSLTEAPAMKVFKASGYRESTGYDKTFDLQFYTDEKYNYGVTSSQEKIIVARIKKLEDSGKLPKHDGHLKPMSPRKGFALAWYGNKWPKSKDSQYIELLKSIGIELNPSEIYHPDAGASDELTAADLKDLKRDVMYVFKGASKGENMTDEINDELGDYFEKIRLSKNKELKRAYNNLRGQIDGSVTKQAKYAKALLDLLK